jgi:hypothetical protein
MQCLPLDEGAGFQRSRSINTPTLSPLRSDKLCKADAAEHAGKPPKPADDRRWNFL